MTKLVLAIWPITLSEPVSTDASLRASQERMIYIPAKESTDGFAKVVYTSKDRKSQKVFNALAR